MGGHDITEKMLESYNDVFADIVNILLFNGEQIIKPEALVDQAPRAAQAPNQILCSRSRDNLVRADTVLSFSAESGDLLAREPGSPKAIDRMASYVRQAHPRNEEMPVDEMLAIKSEIDACRERKESREAQGRYNARLFYEKDV